LNGTGPAGTVRVTMPRILPTYPNRSRIPLDGVWDFQPLHEPASRPPRRFSDHLVVPGVWESAYRHSNHRGFGWYRRSFALPGRSPRNIRLVFEAVSHTGKVWFNGKFLGEHYGAHTEFDFNLTGVKPGNHEVAVLVDNTFGPHNPFFYSRQDLYMYGGIPRSVYVEILPEHSLANVAALPRKIRSGWNIQLRNVPRSARVTLDGRPPDMKQVELWSPENPRLYTVRVETETDVWQERIGFRTIETRGRQLLLNSKPLILRGVNRHEFHPDFGPAVPATIHLRDIEVLKKLGANFVRGSHYPNDPLFLDLCDEHGILFWEELSHWQPKETDLKNPLFRQRSLEQLDEVVTQHQHHPCIILWGMCNELDSHVRAARPVIKELADRFRELDPTRPVTYASHKVEEDLCFDLVDVISLNIYPGWYWSSLEDTGKVTAELIAIGAKRGGRKPMILSEFGAAGIVGVRTFESRKWTEDYQAEVIRQIITTAQQSGKVSGVAIWQYCDVRTSPDVWHNRAREYNNKGIVTEFRQPKQAFYEAARLFRQPWRRCAP
jgi:beta-glucuronidase